MALARPRVGGGSASSRCGARRRRRGGSRSRCRRRCRAAVALAAGRCGCRPSALLLPLLFAPSRLPEPGTARVERARRRARFGGADRHALARAAVRYRRQLEHARRAPAAARAAGARCARAPRASTCWCCRAQRRPRAGRGVVSVRARRASACWSVAAGPAPRCRSPRCADSRFRLGRRGVPDLRGGPGGRYCVLRVSAGAHAHAASRRPGCRRRTRTAGAPRRPARSRATWCS